MTPATLRSALALKAASPFRADGKYAYHAARAKLNFDPAFASLLAYGIIPDRSRVLDLGCGVALLAAWLSAAQAMYSSGDWCDGWPVPPREVRWQGVERNRAAVVRARTALGAALRIEQGDIGEVTFDSADVVVLLDVLHYLERPVQDTVLSKVRAILPPNGLLVLRVGDASGGLRYRYSTLVDQAVLLIAGRGWQPLHGRTLAEWRSVLATHGFRPQLWTISWPGAFANVLIVACPR